MAVDGNYKVEIDTPMGKQEAKLVLKAAGAKLSGNIDTMLGKSDFTGTVTGDKVSWKMYISSPMGKMSLEVNGKVSGPDISGEIKLGAFGNAPFKGKKV